MASNVERRIGLFPEWVEAAKSNFFFLLNGSISVAHGVSVTARACVHMDMRVCDGVLEEHWDMPPEQSTTTHASMRLAHSERRKKDGPPASAGRRTSAANVTDGRRGRNAVAALGRSPTSSPRLNASPNAATDAQLLSTGRCSQGHLPPPLPLPPTVAGAVPPPLHAAGCSVLSRQPPHVADSPSCLERGEGRWGERRKKG
uniref:Uncharacterized protein n=1 Tax=Oryza meridionalis TaxID=40149 RepID=A0A0E0DSU8_9ORYZ